MPDRDQALSRLRPCGGRNPPNRMRRACTDSPRPCDARPPRVSLPALTAAGWLPPGVHLCSVSELAVAFAPGGNPTRRGRLIDSVRDHFNDPTVKQYVEHVLVDGSFVSAKVEPGDVDMVLGIRPGMFKVLAQGSIGVFPAAIIDILEGRFRPFVDGRRVIHGFADEIGGYKYNHYFKFFQIGRAHV